MPRQQAGREGVDGALGESQAGRRVVSGRRQPEAPALLARAVGESLEGVPMRGGARAGNLGTGGMAVPVAALEDSVVAAAPALAESNPASCYRPETCGSGWSTRLGSSR